MSLGHPADGGLGTAAGLDLGLRLCPSWLRSICGVPRGVCAPSVPCVVPVTARTWGGLRVFSVWKQCYRFENQQVVAPEYPRREAHRWLQEMAFPGDRRPAAVTAALSARTPGPAGSPPPGAASSCRFPPPRCRAPCLSVLARDTHLGTFLDAVLSLSPEPVRVTSQLS